MKLHKALGLILYMLAVLPHCFAEETEHERPPNFHNVTQSFVKVAGGEQRLLQEHLQPVLKQASALRAGRTCKLDRAGSKEGRVSLVLRICFDDDQCWAAKVWENKGEFPIIAEQAVNALKAIETYCPDVPHPKLHGDLFKTQNMTFIYYFSDWIDGVGFGLHPDFKEVVEGVSQYNKTFFELVGRQLAHFYYNLTTCPIPDDERILPYLRNT